MRVTVGIMAYNEAKNIGLLLQSLDKQKLKKAVISEIIVISSGSTDQTDEIVRKVSLKNPLVKLITQEKRLGKASAVNLFLKKAKTNLLLLMSADLLLKPNTLEEILAPLEDKKVGIVGSHPVPINDQDQFLGFTAHLLWDLHHFISLSQPKMGELIAFRKIFQQIPVLSAVDEANIEPLIRGQGYKSVYQPRAIVLNKGPENLKEFISVRRRIFCGHLALKHEYSYEVSTMNPWTIVDCLLKYPNKDWRYFLWTPLVILLEGYCRFLGWLDYILKLNQHTVWEISSTSKTLVKKRKQLG